MIQDRGAWSEPEIPLTKKISDSWKEFVENSTLHGLRNAVVHRSVFLRVVWSLIVLGAFSYLVYSTIKSCNRYFQYPTTFHFRQTINNSLVFPAVMICPQNTADKRKILALDNDQDFCRYGLNISACVATAKVRAGIPCGYALLCAYVNTRNLPILGCDKSLKENILKALNFSQVQFNFTEFFLTFSESWSEIIHWCSFGIAGVNCSAMDYFEPIVKETGLCYGFKSRNENVIRSYFPGSVGGLTILLKTQLDRYFLPKYSEGFSVFVNERDTIASIGINAGTGLLTSISLEMKKFKYLKDPYGSKCREKVLKGTSHYSKEACYAECWSDFMYDKCGCRPAGYEVFNFIITCPSVHSECERKAYDDFVFDMCDCPIACEVITYNTEVSYGTLPHGTTTDLHEIFKSDSYSRDSFVIIEIGFKNLKLTQYEERLAFETTSLLGEIGGNMGLLLGCSVLTLVEFLDLVFSLLTLSLRRNNISPQ